MPILVDSFPQVKVSTRKRYALMDLRHHFLRIGGFNFFQLIVVLSGGGDFLLKIWSALDGSCPVTMKGHTKRKQNIYAIRIHNRSDSWIFYLSIWLLSHQNSYIGYCHY